MLDRKLSFQIQTALKIILARHEVPITTHLHLMTCQRRFKSVHDSASACFPAKYEMYSKNFRTKWKYSCWSLVTSFSIGRAHLTLQLNGRLWSLTASGTKNMIIIFSPFFLNWKPTSQKHKKARMGISWWACGSPTYYNWGEGALSRAYRMEERTRWVSLPSGDAPGI